MIFGHNFWVFIISIAIVVVCLCFCCCFWFFYFVLLLYWGSSWGSRETFQPKMSYYAKMGACPMKNSGMTFTFMWNLESLFIYNLAYTIPLVGHGQGLVHCTCLTWDFLIYIIVVIIIIIVYSLKFFLIICGYVRYYFVKILDSPIIYVHDVCIPFYVTFNMYNFSIAFIIAFS